MGEVIHAEGTFDTRRRKVEEERTRKENNDRIIRALREGKLPRPGGAC